MAVEIECKIHVNDLEAIRTHLSKANAQIIKPRIFEQNFRYENAENGLTPNGIVLRLRQDQDSRITYKAPLDSTSNGIVRRLELETSVGDLKIMDAIFKYLGFSVYMIYEKYRTTYHLPDIADVEIVLDEMPYGNFIEIEGDPQAIDVVLERLSLSSGNCIAESYAELFDRVRESHKLPFRDLTFENFANIVIDSAIFE